MVVLRNLMPRLEFARRIPAFLAGLAGLATVAIPATAANWANEKFATYQTRPEWIKTRCENMSKVNQKGISNFTDKVALMEKQYNPNFSRQSVSEILEFYHLFGEKFCTQAW